MNDKGFIVELEPVPTRGGVPVEVRLRRALKTLRRSFGFRAVRVSPAASAVAAVGCQKLAPTREEVGIVGAHRRSNRFGCGLGK
jgi:hypothetical protein